LPHHRGRTPRPRRSARRLEPVRRGARPGGRREVRLGANMNPRHDWKARVVDHARKTGASNLAQHTVDELAAHLEDIYLDAIRAGHGEDAAVRAAGGALAESPLGTVPISRTRIPEARPHASPPGSGWIGIGGDLRFAWRQLRRAPSFA